MALLKVQELDKSFGALIVTDSVSLEVAAGEAVGILGPNGAGKSTLFALIAGTLRPSGGTVCWRGRDVSALPASRRCRLGMGRSFQIPHPFVGMSVYENLLVAASFGDRRGASVQGRCRDILAQTGLAAKADMPAGALGLLERKRLELARAMATNPALLLLDEIAGGLTRAECDALVALIRDLKAQGIAILWIEHVLHALTQVVDRVLVLDRGRLIADGPPDAVLARADVREIYLGGSTDAAAAA
ncbi:ABC transporter ATP-binding protein [Sulfitobacter sp. S190]|uniref:ABC transporter ATP-binding protein n=1 Tax=Sulfitobacter sp. S190 TaxID=2867022 RepID=UPI0021A42C66|nr:ABC transporter ATP-binding protein [Sulfitobacter sp. S190]UWR23172.1 ABC transporter ATP-binding protein [Sulfitobacter sp. S190]